MRRFYVVAALVLIGSALVTLSLLEPIVGTHTDRSIYNGEWNGASALAQDLYHTGALLPTFGVVTAQDDATIIQKSFSDFDVDPTTHSLIILGPVKPPNPDEAAWLKRFVQGGGRLVLADDVGQGNAFLRAIGSTSRFDGSIMLDLAYAKKPEFVVASQFAPHALTTGVGQVVMNYPTALLPSQACAVLGRTDASAWLDKTGSRYKARGDPTGPFPWMCIESAGRGEILLISDPDVFINGMQGIADDAQLRENLVSWTTQGGRHVLVDESHHDYSDPVKLLGARVREIPEGLRLWLAAGASVIFVATVVLQPGQAAARAGARARGLLARLLPSPPEPRPDLVEAARRKHPNWDENALRDIVRRWESS